MAELIAVTGDVDRTYDFEIEVFSSNSVCSTRLIQSFEPSSGAMNRQLGSIDVDFVREQHHSVDAAGDGQHPRSIQPDEIAEAEHGRKGVVYGDGNQMLAPGGAIRCLCLAAETAEVIKWKEVSQLGTEARTTTMTPILHRSRFLLISSMVFSIEAFGDHLDHDSVKRLCDEGRILSMSEVMRRAARIQPGQLLEAELDREDGRYVYEIRILDPAGRVHELELDAASGALIESSHED